MKTFTNTQNISTAIIVNNTHVYGEDKVSFAAHLLAADQNISLTEAYCLIKGIKVGVKGQAKVALEAAKEGFKTVIKTVKLRKVAKAHKRHRKVAKVARSTTVIFDQTKVAVNIAANVRKDTARAILNRVVNRISSAMGMTHQEVLNLQPRDIIDPESGAVRKGFGPLLRALRTIKVLCA